MENDIFKNMFDHLIIPRNLAAIWLTKSIVKGDGTKSPRITKGDQVEIKENELVDCTSPTHEILECYGTTHDQFRIIVKNLETGITSSLQL